MSKQELRKMRETEIMKNILKEKERINSKYCSNNSKRNTLLPDSLSIDNYYKIDVDAFFSDRKIEVNEPVERVFKEDLQKMKRKSRNVYSTNLLIEDRKSSYKKVEK